MPVVTADNTVQSQVNKAADLDAKKLGDLLTATVHLFTNDYNPLPSSKVTDFTEAAFTGYAAKSVVLWTADQYNADGTVETASTNVMSWVGPTDMTGETIYGYYVLSIGGGTPLVYSARFDSPIGLNDATQVLDLVATFVR